MTERSNKRTTEEYFQAWGSADERSLQEILADDFHYNDPTGTEGDKQAYLTFINEMRQGFPDMDVRVERILADGDDVTVRWHATGTHNGTWAGVPATGKRVQVDGLSLVHLKKGKVEEDITEVDMLRVMQQIGAIPGPPPTS